MTTQHKLTKIVDIFYSIIRDSALFWWTLCRHLIVYGVLDGIYAMTHADQLFLKKKQVISFIWSILLVLTITNYVLLQPNRLILAVSFLVLLSLTGLATMYVYEVVALISTKVSKKSQEMSHKILYAQAYLNLWDHFIYKLVFMIVGLLLLKFNMILFLFVFPKVYQLLRNRLSITTDQE